MVSIDAKLGPQVIRVSLCHLKAVEGSVRRKMLLRCVGLLGEALAGVRAGVGGLARPLLLPGGGVRRLAALPRLAPRPALGEDLHSGQLQTAASALSSGNVYFY